MENNLSRKEQEQLLHKNLIIKAAAQIFSEKGYEKTTLDEIAQLAEFSKGSLYNYFENKEDLFLTTLEIGIQKLIEEMKIVSESEPTTALQTKAILSVMVTFFKENDSFNKHRAFFQMMVNEKRVMACQASDEYSNRMQNMHKNMTQFFSEIFKKGIGSSELKNGCPQTYAEVLVGIIHHYIFMVNMEMLEFNQEKADNVFDIFFNGVKAQ
jgi:TetR/AcrR family transcriptional regulator, repressor of fatR-cypB operon